jgi:MFS family permease
LSDHAINFDSHFNLFPECHQVLYFIMALVIIALGVVNTAIASACSQLADSSQVGGLFGALESVESLAGMVGPLVGGYTYRHFGTMTVLSLVVVLYLMVGIAVVIGYRRYIVNFELSSAATTDDSHKKSSKSSGKKSSGKKKKSSGQKSKSK